MRTMMLWSNTDYERIISCRLYNDSTAGYEFCDNEWHTLFCTSNIDAAVDYMMQIDDNLTDVI